MDRILFAAALIQRLPGTLDRLPGAGSAFGSPGIAAAGAELLT
jgi:hypothetical protein